MLSQSPTISEQQAGSPYLDSADVQSLEVEHGYDEYISKEVPSRGGVSMTRKSCARVKVVRSATVRSDRLNILF